MSKKAKITVYCPHCRAEQHEPAIVKSTYCRTCSEYYTITSAVMVPPAAAPSGGMMAAPNRGPRLVTPALPPAAPPPLPPSGSHQSSPAGAEMARSEEAPSSPPPEPARSFTPTPFPTRAASEPAAAAEGMGGALRERFGALFGGAPKSQMVRCFECNGAQEVSGTAHSTICRDCGAYIDLQDYKISGSFSRNIVTRGTVVLAKGGDLSSSKVVCSGATIHGRLRGNLLCSGRVTLRSRGRMPGTLEAGYLVIEKGSEIEFNRPVRVLGLDVSGVVDGPLFECDGHVTIHRTGILRGSVRAKGFFVEKDGGFEGELTIRPRQSPVEAKVPAENEGTTGNPVERLPAEPRRLWTQSAELIGENPLPS